MTNRLVLSGTYVQVIPYIYSVDAGGNAVSYTHLDVYKRQPLKRAFCKPDTRAI